MTLTAWTGTFTGPGRGRNDFPAALYDLYFTGAFRDKPEALAAALEEAWTMAEFPERMVDSSQWVEWFGEAGFIGTPLAAKTLTLYRGATEDTRDGMAWTDSLDQAQWFVDRNNRDSYPSKLWTATVPAHCILAHFDDPKGRGESEYIVDTESLDIVLA